MNVSSERESTPGVVPVANTQDEGRQHETDTRLCPHRFHVPQRACLTAPGQISQQLLEEAFQKEEARKEREEARKEREAAQKQIRKQELHLLKMEERRAKIAQLTAIPAQDAPGGTKRKRSKSSKKHQGKSLHFKRLCHYLSRYICVLDFMLMYCYHR
jgi:hypothetical protein